MRDGASSKSLHGRRFLVVEDNAVNQLLMSGMLAMQGADVDLAANGELGLEVMKTSSYDAIFMDCQMPIVDGYESTILIRSLEAGTHKRIPIVAMTANASEADRLACLEAGMDDYMSKPVKRQDLLEAFQKHLIS